MAKEPSSIVKTNRLLILSLGMFLAWILCARFTSLLFLDSTQVVSSSCFSLATACTLLIGARMIEPLMRRLLMTQRAIIGGGLVALICAVLATAIPYMFSPSEPAILDLTYLGIGFLFGVVLFGFIVGEIVVYKRSSLVTSCVLLIAAATIAVLALVLFEWLVTWQFGYVAVAFPCLGFAFLVMSTKAEKRSTAATPKQPRVVSKLSLLHLLLFFCGFLVTYMPTMFPKTTNLTIGYFDYLSLGGVNYTSLAALVICVAFLIFVWLLASGKARGISIVTFLVTVIFAGVFYLLSSMSTSNLSFLMVMPCSILFVLCSCAVFLATVDLTHDEGLQRLRNGLMLIASGGLAAAVFSALFMGPFYGSLDFQDTLFVVVVASVFVTIIVLSVSVRSDYVALFLPNVVFREKLDTSSLENRCRMIGSQYRLTTREVEVLILLAEGRNEPYIAEALTVARATTKTHIKHIYQKIGVSSRQALLDILRCE
jgi:DNA-binding CsgD family transcriptional regulator